MGKGHSTEVRTFDSANRINLMPIGAKPRAWALAAQPPQDQTVLLIPPKPLLKVMPAGITQCVPAG